jgi:hypothetical protein
MPNLFDTIQQNKQQLAGQAAPNQDQSLRVRDLLRAKSGQSVTENSGQSNLAEQSAVADTNTQLSGLATSNQIASQGEKLAAAGQEQQIGQQKQAIKQENKFNTVQNNLRTNQLLGELARDKGQLNLDQNKAKLEQTAFLLSMQDKKYTDQLNQIGQRRRLDNQVAFNQELEQVAFKDSLGLLKAKLRTGNVLSSNDRDFARAMSELTIDDALKIAALESKYGQEGADMENSLARYQAGQQASAANQQAMFQGIGQLASTGLSAYDKMATDKDKKAYYTTGKGSSDTSFEAEQYRKEG